MICSLLVIGFSGTLKTICVILRLFGIKLLDNIRMKCIIRI